ncbi:MULTISPECIES: hypothetical protein [unclassified Haladaptatus]|uniref:hypothetical protein n=1 Tax=unclassified Haladaptatus TaxID=2622732 RepID=UPI0023E80B2B|nr:MULTISPECIES: hypothetical protein [unclassified Haladaptatus]
MKQSTINFALLFVGACVALAGVGMFFPFADMNYNVDLIDVSESPPAHKSTAYYEEMDAEEKEIFEKVKDGGVVTKKESFGYPEVVKYQGQYYHIRYFSTFDWLNPSTFGPALIALVGSAMAIMAIRRDMRERVVY